MNPIRAEVLFVRHTNSMLYAFEAYNAKHCKTYIPAPLIEVENLKTIVLLDAGSCPHCHPPTAERFMLGRDLKEQWFSNFQPQLKGLVLKNYQDI